MNSIQEIKNLADLRLRESRALLVAGFFDGAYYLGGYALELALKALVCKHLDIPDLFADSSLWDSGAIIKLKDHKEPFAKALKVHDLNRLIIFSGLKSTLENEIGDNPDFNTNWIEVSKWNESARYAIGKSFEETSSFLDSIDNPHNGILTWLKNHW